MKRSFDSETELYRRLYVEYAPMLLRFTSRFVPSFNAEDIVQDVFLKLWDKELFKLEEPALKRILYAATRNACMDYLRRFTLEKEWIDKQELQLKLDELNYLESSDDLLMRKDLIDFILKKVEELPTRTQEAFRLFYLDELKAIEIAEKMDISVRTVENLLYRALQYLRKNCPSFVLLFFL